MSASISPCGQYRWRLERRFDSGSRGPMLFVMLNPSTADADMDDATIRRCISFAKRDGYSGIVVVNLYGFRATDPAELWLQSDPIGWLNDCFIINECHRVDDVVLAWGATARPGRVAEVVHMIESAGPRMLCLGVTKHGGHPRHPLYVKGDQPFVPWQP